MHCTPVRHGRHWERIRQSPAGPRQNMYPENLRERPPSPAAIARRTDRLACEIAETREPGATEKTSAAASARGKQQSARINKAAAAATVTGAVLSATTAPAAHDDVKCRARSQEQFATDKRAVSTSVIEWTAKTSSLRSGDLEIIQSC